MNCNTQRKEYHAVSSAFSALKKHLITFATAPIKITLPILAALAFILNFALEAFGRHSLFEACRYLVSEPLLFLCNTLIVFFTLSLCLLFRKRLTLLLILTAFWLALGITNYIVLSFRSSPLSAIDFLIVKAALSMFTIYLSVVQTILLSALIAAFITALVLLYIKCPKCRVSYKKSISCVAAIGLAVWGAFAFTTSTAAVEFESGQLSEAYDSYGFAYCFTRSLVSQGVDRPSNYENSDLDELIESLGPDENDSTGIIETPNVIFVQLESFFDASYIKHLTYSEDPTPTFTSLKENGVSGFLRVSTIGGGTANTEFEILTGMNLDHFGFGEYPYTTVLKDQTCASLAFDLKTIGYATHAIHNHTATFYDRNIVYANLGFDTFTPIELMRNITRNPLGWAHDSMLTEEIMSALDSTDAADFVFAVSVQGHGRYPEEPFGVDDADTIDVFGSANEVEYSQYRYYVNQLNEIDQFIAQLIATLEMRDEPSVVVFYGDHLPATPLTNDDVTNGDLYETEYAVWSNFPLGQLGDTQSINTLDRDLEAYRLSAYVQKLIGLEVGNITLLHQAEFESGNDLDESLQILEYAQLYDDAANSYTPTELVFGTRPPVIRSYSISGNTLYVFGDGFNEYSSVKLDGFVRNTQFIDSQTLAIENVFFSSGEPEVVQVAEDGTELCCAQWIRE